MNMGGLSNTTMKLQGANLVLPFLPHLPRFGFCHAPSRPEVGAKELLPQCQDDRRGVVITTAGSSLTFSFPLDIDGRRKGKYIHSVIRNIRPLTEAGYGIYFRFTATR